MQAACDCGACSRAGTCPASPHLPSAHGAAVPHPPCPPPAPQGDFLDQAAELIIKQFKEVKKGDVFYIESKKKTPYFDEEEGGE